MHARDWPVHRRVRDLPYAMFVHLNQWRNPGVLACSIAYAAYVEDCETVPEFMRETINMLPESLTLSPVGLALLK